jgi:transcription elongation GreA/GreB family factor
MEAVAHIPMGEEQFEAWFLSKIADPDMPVDDMLAALRELRPAGMVDSTNSWAELMEDALIEQGKPEGAVRVLRLRAEWNAGNPAFRDLCTRKLTSLYRNDPVQKKFVISLGLERGGALQECFRRLETLQKLKAGVLCVDKTWGVGAIRKVDAFYERVTIDFSRKMGHEMSFAYAAETLQLVDDAHLLARKYRDAVALAALVETEAAELVRIALRSYGPLPVARLQEILQDGIVRPDGWKIFWESARKALKADPLVVIPTKRNEPIILLERQKAYDATWFSSLGAERTAEGIFARLDELAGNVKPDELDVPSLRIIGERLAFLMKGFGDKDLSVRVQVVVLARGWKVALEYVNWEREASRLVEETTFVAAASAVTSKRLETLLELLASYDSVRLYETITASIPEMTMNVLNACLTFMLEHEQDATCAAVFKELVGMRKAGVEVLFWLSRRPDRLAAWGLGTLGDLAFQILPALEKTYTGERLRAANQLAELVQQREWLEAAAQAMNEVQRSSFIRYLYSVMGKLPVDTQAMIGRMVRVYPELAEILASKADRSASEAPKGGLTSWRSYRQRQKLLGKIVNEDIPRNSRDIGVARSYGDLRENFEYKTAKEQQGILMHRSAELEQDLNMVRGTDFSGCSADRAGMGTTVSLQMDDGSTQQFHILGEWDQDAEMGIISCSSRMGKVLAGHCAGEELMVPGDQGEVRCRIAGVAALPETIMAWAKEEDPHG